MCGIVGYIGTKNIFADAAASLGRLEYRGYDSFGFVYKDEGYAKTIKDIGAIGDAISSGRFDGKTSRKVLCHTRWATHGGVSQANAHPHSSYDGRITIVHNGVIENYKQLRKELDDLQIKCLSETDSEVVAHLIANHLSGGDDILAAIRNTLRKLQGEYALGIVDNLDDEKIYGARLKSPLLVANVGSTGVLASDPIAIPGTTTITYLEDGDLVVLKTNEFRIFECLTNQSRPLEVRRKEQPFEVKANPISKGDFDHFMIKEIYECAGAVETALSMPDDDFRGLLGTGTNAIVGAGSAFFVALIGQYFFADLCREILHAVPSDEAPRLLCFNKGDGLIALSQSGETYDTLEAIRSAKLMGANVVSVVNVPESSVERASLKCIRQNAGSEICVLSTKSVLSQITIMLRIALERGIENNTISRAQYTKIMSEAKKLPQQIDETIYKQSERIKKVSAEICNVRDLFFLGKGNAYPVALESALKFKEVSYNHAEGMAAGFLKHGTISLIGPEFHTVAFLPSKTNSETSYHATLSAISEILARGGPVIGIGPSDIAAEELSNFKYYIPIDYLDNHVLDVFQQLIVGQLLAYYCAVNLGRNVDKPRGLAKSVTVR